MTVTRTHHPDGRIDATCDHCGMAVIIPKNVGVLTAIGRLIAFQAIHQHEGKRK